MSGNDKIRNVASAVAAVAMLLATGSSSVPRGDFAHAAATRYYHALPTHSLSCARTGPATPFLSRDSSGVRIAENSASLDGRNGATVAVSAAPILSIGGETADQLIVRIAGVARFSNGDILLGDLGTTGMRVFDSTGRLLRRIGRKGQGPGEFEDLSSLLILSGDTILVADRTRRRLTYFQPTGTVIRMEPFIAIPYFANPYLGRPPVAGSYEAVSFRQRMTDGSYLATTRPTVWFPRSNTPRPPGVHSSTLYVHRFSQSLQRFDTLLSLTVSPQFSRPRPEEPRLRIGVGLPFGKSGSLATHAAGFYTTSGETFEIRGHGPDGRVTALIRYCAAPEPVTRADIARWTEEYVATALPSYKESFQQLARLITYPSTKPAFTQLVVDAAGRVWAKTYNASSEPARWMVFDQNGRYVTDALLPPLLDVKEIGTNYILAVSEGADMVQTVKVFSVRWVN